MASRGSFHPRASRRATTATPIAASANTPDATTRARVVPPRAMSSVTATSNIAAATNARRRGVRTALRHAATSGTSGSGKLTKKTLARFQSVFGADDGASSGCFGSAVGLLALALAGFVGPAWPLQPSVFFLGAANGAFAVSAIGSMMGLAGDGKEAREGLRMGLWGAAQAGAFALGGLVATIGSDLARHLLGTPAAAYATVFAGEAILFLFAARLAAGVFQIAPVRQNAYATSPGPTAVLATGRV